MKTRQQVIDEYRNRQEKPEYDNIGVLSYGDDKTKIFDNVCNLIEFEMRGREWVSFDYLYNGTKKHIEINGFINSKANIIDE